MSQTEIPYSVLAPGPVNLHPKVLEALSLPMIHHRTPEFDRIFKKVLVQLKEVFSTSEAVYTLSTTGSGGMEALLVNTLSPGDQVLAVVSGKFGERWAEMSEAFGARVHQLKLPWGEALDPELVRLHLEKNPHTRAVLSQACETSTGVLHPIKALGEVVKSHPDCLLLVDGITAVGSLPLPMDLWHIDGLVAGSQKAFMLPTGLSFVSFSKKAQSFWHRAKMNKYYLDIRKEKLANDKGETHFSSSVSLIRALSVVLDLILQQGLENLHHQILQRALRFREGLSLLNLELYTQSPSPSLTAFRTGPQFDSQKLRTQLEEEFRITIMGGQDQAKGKILRVGHMGHISLQEERNLLEAMWKIFHASGKFQGDESRWHHFLTQRLPGTQRQERHL